MSAICQTVFLKTSLVPSFCKREAGGGLSKQVDIQCAWLLVVYYSTNHPAPPLQKEGTSVRRVGKMRTFIFFFCVSVVLHKQLVDYQRDEIMCHFALQNGTYQVAKQVVLQCKTTHFAKQNDWYWKSSPFCQCFIHHQKPSHRHHLSCAKHPMWFAIDIDHKRSL